MEQLIKEIEARIKSHELHFRITGDSYWCGKEIEAMFILEKLKQLQNET